MSGEAVERVSLLAIAWDRKVLVAKLKSKLETYGEWSIDSAAIGLAWLDDQVLYHLLFPNLATCCQLLLSFYLIHCHFSSACFACPDASSSIISWTSLLIRKRWNCDPQNKYWCRWYWR